MAERKRTTETTGRARLADAAKRMRAQFRPAYLAEIERFAQEEVRPRYEAGKIHAAARRAARHAGDPGELQFQVAEQIEALAAKRFGLKVKELPRGGYSGDEDTAHFIVAVSPSAARWVGTGWTHPAYYAAACIGTDVLVIAKAQRWAVRS